MMYVQQSLELVHWARLLTPGFVQIKEKRLHVPLVDRIPEEAPPLIVAVVGPAGVSLSIP